MIYKAAVVQLNSGADKQQNLRQALAIVRQAAADGCRLVCLPEYFSFIGPGRQKKENAEPVPGPTCRELQSVARDCGIYLHGGTLQELSGEEGKYDNTSLLFDPAGRVLATYRKIHLFDVELPGGAPFCESSFLLPGGELAVAETELGHIGLSICYDLRFPELYRSLALAGAQLFVVPAAFALSTGKDHWEPLLRARAIENQAYVLAAAQDGSHPSSYPTFGNSMIIDPWGTVLARAPERSGYCAAPIDLAYQADLRRRMPVFKQRAPHLYSL